MAIKIYKRTIDLVHVIRCDGGVPNEEKYKKGNNKYVNVINYIKSTVKVIDTFDHDMIIHKTEDFIRALLMDN